MVRGHIGMTAGDQPVAQVDHFADVFRGAGLHRRRQYTQCSNVGVELPGRLLGQPADSSFRRQVRIPLGGPRVDLVVDVRDVANVGDVFLAVDFTE